MTGVDLTGQLKGGPGVGGAAGETGKIGDTGWTWKIAHGACRSYVWPGRL